MRYFDFSHENLHNFFIILKDLIKKMNFNFTKNATEQNKSEEEQ